MTQAAKVDTVSPNSSIWQAAPTSAIYWLQTSTGGSVYISGNGGSGRSVLHAWEITGFNSATPFSTATAQNTDASSFSKTISIATKYNGCTIGSGVTEDTNPTGSVTVSNSDSLQQIDLESATNHYTWRDEGTSEGTTSYNCDQNIVNFNFIFFRCSIKIKFEEFIVFPIDETIYIKLIFLIIQII